MADLQRANQIERDVEQAITALKKGAYLLKYGRRGKPKFCPFRLSSDESALIWYYGKEEKQLELRHVSRLIPGQRTSIFQRYPRPEKEYQSFSLIHSERSLDLICKDKDEAEVWILGLKALIARNSNRKVRNDGKYDNTPSDSPRWRKFIPSSASFDQGDGYQTESNPKSRLGKAFADIMEYTAATKSISQAQGESYSYNSVASLSSAVVDNINGRNSASESRVSLSSAVSSSSQGSIHEDFDSLGDVFVWGEGAGDGILGGGVVGVCTSGTKMDAHLPKPLESTTVLDAYSIACGRRHAALVTKQGDIFSWGEESGGRLGHGVEADFSHPKLIDGLSGVNIEMVACGEYHTCAATLSGDLYTWGDGTFNSGLLGHGSDASHRIPKKVNYMDGIHVSYVSCGTWHTALTTSAGQLFTFGDGTFGALGHGDQKSTCIPREVEVLVGMKAVTVACGVWHTAAVVEVIGESSNSETSDGPSLQKLFTWGDGDKGRLGHGDQVSRLVPECVASLIDVSFSKVSCGTNMTVALTTSGQVYTMGSTEYGQLGTSSVNGKIPTCLEGKFGDSTVEEIACGSHHVAALTSKNEVYTWGNGACGQLGHGDKDDRRTPSLVDFLKDRQVKRVICGGNVTAVICLHRWISGVDNTMCFSCRNPFNFRRKRHNCYNCGLVFCNPCSSRKSMKASLGPTPNKPYRVCDDCFNKLQRTTEGGPVAKIPHTKSANMLSKFTELLEKETGGGSAFQGHASRLSADSEGRSSLNSPKNDGFDRQIFSMFNGSGRKGNIFLSKQSTAQPGSPVKKFSLSVPSSRTPSRATSPIYGKTSSPLSTRSVTCTPIRTSELIFDATKQRNESLSQEVIRLRAQVEELAAKSRHLEGELEKKSVQLKEATALAADEAEKCNAAKEVIKSLTTKLKDLAEGQSTRNNFDPIADELNHSSNASSLTSQISTKSESNGNSSNSALANGSKKSADKVVQDEPGVYVTLSPLPGGGNELKRVRFSRKRFTEQQAEKWWAENGDKVCERHNIVTAD